MAYVKRLPSPYERGDSDAYYGRSHSPHKLIYQENGWPLRETDLTDEERAEYDRGYDENPSGRKDWGE